MNEQAVKFFRTLKSAEKDAIAQKCGIDRRYLNNLIYSRDRNPGVSLAANLEKASNGRIKREDLRPDIDWNLLGGTY